MRVLLTAMLMGLIMDANAQTENFDKTATGALPEGWNTGVTGQGTPRWAVSADASAPSAPGVLAQTGRGTFPWAAREGVSIADGFVEVKFKAISGKEDQAGGVMWRWKDGNNYYVARANALENNVSLYYTAEGRRNTIKYIDAPVPRDTWHTLRVDFVGPRIQVALNGKTYIDVKDTRIAGPGAVGVWTKADSVTSFDDFSYGKAP
jgi:FtsP/CotA-like multicopper oxidase with cupredoxin domain